MKRNFKSGRISLVSMILASSLLASCSSLWSHRELGQQKPIAEEKSPTVPREQYEEVVRKYQELLAESKNMKKVPVQNAEENKVAETNNQVAANGQLKPEAPQTNLDPSDLVNHIDQAVPDQKSPTEGVDVIGSQPAPKVVENAKANPPLPETMGVQHVNNTDDVDDQITRLREAENLIKVNKFENALTILKELEGSKEKQIAVRAKIMLGDLLFGQGEYDLAMQVYEEVVKKYAFSGYVLKALGKLVACSEKLKLPEKQAKYYSLLHDFFEAT